jgi:cytochrome c oxidase assembly factor CtaG
MIVWIGLLIILAGTAVIFAKGWQRVRQLNDHPDADILIPTSRHALITFNASLILLLVALGPLNFWTQTYFSAHVVQHLLLTAWVPSLFWIAGPVPVLYMGLSVPWRQRLYHWGQRLRPHLGTIRALTAPGLAWLVFAATFWLWYDPGVREAVGRWAWIRPLEPLTLLLASFLYWWHITAADPIIHKPLPPILRMLYVLIGAWPIKIVGFIILLSPKPIYTYPKSFALSGLNIDDVKLGGILIWVLGGIVFTFTATMLMRRWLDKENLKPSLPPSLWATEEALKAPHL